MSKKISNFLIKNSNTIRKGCYVWISLVVLIAIGFTAYFIYFADWPAVNLTQDIGMTSSQFMSLVGVTVTGFFTGFMLVPALAIIDKIKKLSI